MKRSIDRVLLAVVALAVVAALMVFTAALAPAQDATPGSRQTVVPPYAVTINAGVCGEELGEQRFDVGLNGDAASTEAAVDQFRGYSISPL